MKHMTIPCIILTLAVITHGYQNNAATGVTAAPLLLQTEPVSVGSAPPAVPAQLSVQPGSSGLAGLSALDPILTIPSNPLSFSKSKVNTLVIPKPNASAQTIAEITEDIAIMCRVLDKKLNKPPDVSAYQFRSGEGYRFQLAGSNNVDIAEAIYIDGYGVLFMLESKVPLTPPPPMKDVPAETGDEVWLETKGELLTNRTYNSGQKSKPKQYDPEESEELQKLLIETLKHATNIRHVNADDAITLVVKTPAPTPAALIRKSVQVNTTGGESTYTAVLPSETTAVSSAVLTISAKKADIDAYAKGDQQYEQFLKKIQKIDY